MTLKQRYQQAAKEASWALGLSILYVIGWCLCAYLPILFIIIGHWIIKIIYQDISLEIKDEENQK